jgi:hypothetical protein
MTTESTASRVPEVRLVRSVDTTTHWLFLVMSSGVLMAALVLDVRGTEHVVLPLLDATLPGTCTFRIWFGSGCPGCGLTRCFVSLAHGDVAGAWSFNPAGILLFGIVLAQIPYRAAQIWRVRHGWNEWQLGYIAQWSVVVLVVLMSVQWILRTFVFAA